MNKKVVLEFDADTKKVDEKLEGLSDSVGDVKTETSGAVAQIDKLSGGAISAFKNGIKGAKGLIQSMGVLKTAIIATGIGALVIAVVALIQAMSRLQRVQDQYKQLTAGLSVVMDVLLDTVALLGEQLIIAFTDPKKALEDIGDFIKTNLMNRLEGILNLIPNLGKAWAAIFKGDFAEAGKIALNSVAQISTGVENLTDVLEQAAPAAEEYARKLLEAAKQAAALEAVEQRLQDLQISQIKTQATRNKQIAEARLISKDTTLSFQERAEALENALELESKNLEEQLANARVEANLIKQRNALSESSREDRRAEAEAFANIQQLEERSLSKQKEAFTELQSLRAQQAAEIKKANDAKIAQEKALQTAQDEINQALIESTATAQEKEILLNEQKFNKLLDLAVQYGQDTAELEEAREAQLNAINEKFRLQRESADQKEKADELKREQELKDQKVSLFNESITAFLSLTEAFGKGNDASAKRQFKIAKAAGIAQALVNTFNAVTAQLAVPQDALTGANFIKAGIAGATGLAQVAKISKTKFQSSASGGGGSVSAPSSGGGGSEQTAPSVDFGFLQQGANQNTIQAYVLEQNVSNSQQANQLIQDQASL